MTTLLQALLLNWVAFLFGGFTFGKLDETETRRMPTWTRLASSLALTAAAWVWFLQTNGTDADVYSFPIAIGMTLGLIGDIFMSGWLMGIPDALGGMVAFGLGHIAYIIGMLRYGDLLGLNDTGIRLALWGVWLLVGFVGWLISVRRYAKNGLRLLHKLALVYTLLLSSTAGVATALAIQSDRFIPLAIGAVLFLFSDLLIAVRMFGGVKFFLSDDLVWLTYGPAQALIVYALAYAGV